MNKESHFYISPGDQEKINEWMSKRKTALVGAIGGRYEYVFFCTTIGCGFKVRDTINGAELDLTNYMDW